MGQGIVGEDCESLSINWHSRISKRKDLLLKSTKNKFFNTIIISMLLHGNILLLETTTSFLVIFKILYYRCMRKLFSN